jgi:DNA-binding NarL/FixJ family response regulator
MTTVAIIEDDEVYRDGLVRLLNNSKRFKVTGAYGSTEEALKEMPAHPPAIALVDISLPGQPGPTAVLRLRELCPETKCVMCTIFEDTENLFAALQAGATGYLLKSAPPEELLAGLDELLAGGAPMSRPIARRVLASFAKPAASAPRATGSPAFEGLSERECEIMEHLARGLVYKEIGSALGISSATVKNHLYRIYGKLTVHSRTEAVVKWLGRANKS